MEATAEAGDTRPGTTAPRPPRISAAAARALAEERALLHELRELGVRARLEAYLIGEAVERNEQSGLYKLEGKHTSATAFVAEELQLDERTVRRALRLREAFTRSEFLTLRAQGICVSLLERIAEAEPDARQPMLEVARQVKDIVAVSAAYTALRKQKEKNEAAADPVRLMLEVALRELKKRALEKAGLCGNCGLARSGAHPPHERRDTDRGADKMSNAPPPNSTPPPPPSSSGQPPALSLEVLREHARLQAELDKMSADRDALQAALDKTSADHAALRAELDKTSAERAALQAELDKMSAAPAQQPDAEAAGLAAELAGQRSEHQRLVAEHERLRAALTQAEAALAERVAQLHREQAADLWSWEERLRHQEAALTQRTAELDERDRRFEDAMATAQVLSARFKDDEEAIRARERRLADERYNLDQRERDLLAYALMADECKFRWRAQPGGLCGSLMYIADLLDNAAYAAAITYQINVLERREHLNPSELGLALDVIHHVNRVRESANTLAAHVAREYNEVHPRLALQEMRAYEEARKLPIDHEGAACPALKPLKPASKLAEDFAIPIRAVVGTSRTFVKDRGLLGTLPETGEGVLLALSRPLALLVAGQQGSGKTHLLLVIIEMLIKQIKHISTLARSFLAVWFHFGLSEDDYPADLQRALAPNSIPSAVDNLRELGAEPCGLAPRLVVFVPPHLSVATLEKRRAEYPGAEIRRIRFGQADRFPGHMSTLLQLEGGDSAYQRWMDKTAARLGADSSPEEMHAAVDAARKAKRLDAQTCNRLHRAIDEARPWLAVGDDAKRSIWEGLDGAAVIVDMRASGVTQREALGAAMMLLASLSLRRAANGDFLPAVAVLDELIKVLASGDLPLTFTTLLNEIRHRLTWILFSLQFAGDLPNKLAQACNGVMASRTEGAANHSALCAIKPGYNNFSREAAAALRRGQFACCFSDTSDPELAGKVFVIDIRDTCAMPGGQTRSATSEDGDSAE